MWLIRFRHDNFNRFEPRSQPLLQFKVRKDLLSLFSLSLSPVINDTVFTSAGGRDIAGASGLAAERTGG